MSETRLRYVDGAAAQELVGRTATRFAVIPNGPEVFPPFEVVPLGPVHHQLSGIPRAVLFDMDGTTTMTEDLCMLALDTFLRKAMGRPGETFPGMDPATDYPHIIGHSSSKNVEHLVRTYGDRLDRPAFLRAYAEAVAWTLACSNNPDRRAEAVDNLEAMGGSGLPQLPALQEMVQAIDAGKALPEHAVTAVSEAFLAAMDWTQFGTQVRAGLEIYYQTLQALFERIASGDGQGVAEEVYGPGTKRPVNPLPGVGMAMAYARGLLAEDAEACFDYLASNISEAVSGDRPTLKQRFVRGARAFAESPAPVALVTSSGRYEVDVVIPVVFEGLRDEVANWPVGAATRTRVLEAFEDYEQFYAAIVTASDSHEIRLKPYRDLYSIALQQLGLDATGAEQVVGFEDTEPGIVASRAAGVGMPCAVPFEGTLSHDFSAAAHVLHGGVTEALVGHALFLPDSLVAG